MKSCPSWESDGPGREFVVVGIDPGSIATGYGSIRRTVAGVECLGFGCIRPAQGRPFESRLEDIYDRLIKVFDAYKPDRIAVETIFHSRSARSALVMGHVRGVVLLAAAKAGVRVFEYTPLEVKLSVVGSGAASKKQVQFMIEKILSPSGRLSADASDALAIALCHVNKTARGSYNMARR
jgi:crossover junction endodeoxyribonuclease RuvC